ncbi:uncharacterized protein ACRADG_010951 [Cochliomyia hominivorax]
MSFGGFYHPGYTPGLGSRPRFQTTHPFRHLVAAGSHNNNQWSGGSGHSGYGMDTVDYDYHSGPPSHVPSGGSYSYHSTTGTGYGPPAAPIVHPPPKPSGGGGKKGILGGGGKKGSSALSALTLLSFLFFINLLQGCIKDHMDAMNPTVMVMTTNIIRNRFNKMGEMNSREQSSGYSSSGANIVMQPADLVAAAAQSSLPANMESVNLQSPYSSSNAVSFNKPTETHLPAVTYNTQPSQPPVLTYNPQSPVPPYTPNSPEPEIPISYAKPQYDPHKPDPYEQVTSHLSSPQHIYNNHTLLAQPPPYKLPAQEQHYNYHHTEYSAAQPIPQPTIVISQHSISSNPFYEHQHPEITKPFGGDHLPQYAAQQPDYSYHPKYETSPLDGTSNNAHPWSSNLQSSSVLSGPFRRASIISVSPKSKWISVPAKITDHTQFNENIKENIEEEIEHHDDRDVFHTRFN